MKNETALNGLKAICEYTGFSNVTLLKWWRDEDFPMAQVEKAGILHAPVGKVSFGLAKLRDNVAAFMDTVMRLKPASSKGTYIKAVAVSTTMGPGIKIDPIYVKNLFSG